MADKATQTAAPRAAGPQPAAAPPATWFLDANTLRCIVQQETNLTKGDEVYVASLKIRTTPSVAGTTSVVFTGGLVNIANVNTGETHPIPNAMGRVPFANVTRLGATEIAAGQVPEIIATATLVFEADLTRKAKVEKLLTEAADEIEPILAEASENVVVEDLLDEGVLEDLLDQLIDDITEAVELTVGQKLLLFFGAVGDPDDPIERKVNVFFAVDDVLAPLVDTLVGNKLDPDLGVGGGVRTRTYTQRFSGRGATYDISFTLSK